MSQTIVANRYAKAWYDESVGEGVVDKVDRDVDVLRSSLEGSQELRRFFSSPIISREAKLRVTDALFEGRVCETTRRFLRLLVSKRREDVLGLVLDSYRALRNEQLGIVEARASVAREGSKKDLSRLAAALGESLGKEIRLDMDVDPSLLGGVLVRVGDTVLDGSARNRLERLRERFASGGGQISERQ
jgi:F-type H+-transporting ATPase subunit delta